MLLKSYLTNRKQFVSIDQYESSLQSIDTGVPQGSNLGPVLFLLFINDLSKLGLIGELRLFADDTCILYKASSCETILQNIKHDVNILMEYFKANVLSMNLEKTKYMIIRSPRRQIPAHDPLIINGQILEEVSNYRFLGLVIDSTMSWKPHIEALKKKTSSLCGILKKISSFVPLVCLKNIYFSLIHSRFQYLIANWGNASKASLRELQVIQNRCLKIILRKPFLYPTRLLYTDSQSSSILPIRSLHEFQILTQMHKIATNQTLHQNYGIRRMQYTRASRQIGSFALVRPRTEFGRKRFLYLGGKLYNELPNVLKSQQRFNVFKKDLRTHFKQKITHYIS